MTQENKDLLLKDLCARLPYGVKIQVYYEEMTGSGYFDETVWVVDNDEPFHVNDRWIENIKPYLRPIHKLTEEELEELEFLIDSDYVDYCNKHHIDYRNLITKGLALEAPEGMYNLKDK